MTDGPGWTLGSPARSGPRRLCGGALFFDQSVGRPKIGGSNRLGGTRTLNAQFEPRILSPLRLPIPPRAQNLTLPIPRWSKRVSVGRSILDSQFLRDP